MQNIIKLNYRSQWKCGACNIIKQLTEVDLQLTAGWPTA